MIKIVLVSLVLWGLSGQLYAQDTLTVNFEEAVALAIKKNAAHNINVNNQLINKVNRQQAFYANFPTLGINIHSQRVRGQQSQQVDDEIIVDNFTNYGNSASLYVNLPVFNMFRRVNTYKAEKLREEAGALDLARSEQEVIFQVANQYLQVLLGRELLRIAEENLENQKELLRQIEGYVEVGIRTLSDAYNQQSEVARLEAVNYDAQIQLLNDVFRLAEIMHLEEGWVPDVMSIGSELLPNSFKKIKLEELLARAAGERPEIQRDEQLIKAYSKEVKASKAGFMPSINAFYGYNSFSTSIVERSFNQQFFEVNPSGVIGVSLNIPIFSNFEHKANLARSNVALLNQQITRDASKRKVYHEVRLAHANYLAAERKLETTTVQLKAAEEAIKVISERFRLGISNFVDLAQANQQLVQAQSDLAQARYTRYFQNIMLMYAVGDLDISF
ncbi:MAG: TolC family protein [Anditalea sp.]